jgi:hypothetical protein
MDTFETLMLFSQGVDGFVGKVRYTDKANTTQLW